MACRTWALCAVSLLLVPAAGCSLARTVLTSAGPGLDAGVADSGGGVLDTGPRRDTGTPADTGMPADTGAPTDTGPRPDGATTCTTSCDDGQPCTDDACSAAGTCTHTPNTASCNDGVLCNGADTCGGGTCSVHDNVDPCPGASHCDVPSDMCTGCATSADCPGPIPGDWGACDFGSDLCATTGGTQMRSVMTFSCNRGTCEVTTSSESQTCTRASTDGLMCAAGTFSDWSACDFGTDPCTQAGTQTRTATTSHCSGGTCTPMDTIESQACMRTTDGMSCAATTTSPWSACMVGATCATTGTQTRTTTMSTCTMGACVASTTSEMQSCMPMSVIGSTCGTTTCSPWGSCTQTMPGTCDRTGVQTRMCSTPVCASGGCTGTTSTTEMQACSASVNGVSCGGTTCGACREPGRTDCRHGHTGFQRCSTLNGTCMDYGLGPFCGGLPTVSTVACNCP